LLEVLLSLWVAFGAAVVVLLMLDLVVFRGPPTTLEATGPAEKGLAIQEGQLGEVMHRIRLAAPWQFEAAGHLARWTRSFHRPTGLDVRQRVRLRIEGVETPGKVVLNGRMLGVLDGAGAPVRFDVSDKLRARNELRLELASSFDGQRADRSTPPGEIRLEIDGP
jgi:hypothetical protein